MSDVTSNVARENEGNANGVPQMPIDLAGYLASLPKRLLFDRSKLDALETNVMLALFCAATDNGRYIEEIFSHLKPNDVAGTDNEEWGFPVYVTPNRKKFVHRGKPPGRYFHLKLRICSRLIGEGEPLYRCEQCGFDDTCVLCHHCFNPADHEGHDVRMSLSRGNGGMCDCGDREAFAPTNCPCARNPGEDDALPAEFETLLATTIETALEYVLDVLNFSVTAMPVVDAHLNHGPVTSTLLSEALNLPLAAYLGFDDTNSESYVLVLWNDEHHVFEEAQEAIRAGLGVSNEEAQQIANVINLRGRAVLLERKDYRDLLPFQRKVAQVPLQVKDPLVSTIMLTRDYYREEIVVSIFEWLRRLTEKEANPRLHLTVSRILADCLLKSDRHLHKGFPQDLAVALCDNDHCEMYRNGLVADGRFVPLTSTEFNAPPQPDGSWANPVAAAQMFSNLLDLEMVPPSADYVYLWLQFLLIFEPRLPKQVRQFLPHMLTASLVADPDTKRQFADQLMEVYPQLAVMQATTEREDQINVLVEVAVQLLTCPVTIQHLVATGKFGNLVAPLVEVIEARALDINPFTHQPSFQLQRAPVQFPKPSALTAAIIRQLSTLDHASGVDMLGKQLLCARPEVFALFVYFLRFFQFYWRVSRKLGDHVEYDQFDLNTFIQVTLTMMSIAGNLARNIRGTIPPEEQYQFAAVVAAYMAQGDPYGHAIQSDLRVSTTECNAYNGLLVFLLMLLVGCPNEAIPSNMTLVAFPSLRSVVFSWQTRIGLWVRNGPLVARLVFSYLMPVATGLPYFHDLYLCQLVVLKDDPVEALEFFLFGWEMHEWFRGDETIGDTVYEDDRFADGAQALVTVLYQMLVDRLMFSPPLEEEVVHQGICYALCDEPLTYSLLLVRLNDEWVQSPKFDGLLSEVAEFVAPAGLVEEGKYRLRSNVVTKLDIMSKYMLPGQFDRLSTLQHEALGPVLTPRIDACGIESVDSKLGDFFNAKNTAKLIYKLLQVAEKLGTDTFLPQLLHWLHAILVDNAASGRPLSQHMAVGYPIADRLVTIVRLGSFSPLLAAKARAVFEAMAAQDSRITENAVATFEENFFGDLTGSSDDPDAKKRRAERRKLKVMKKFARQQQKFMNQHKDADWASESPVAESVHYLWFQCAHCNEDILPDTPFGLMANAFGTLGLNPADKSQDDGASEVHPRAENTTRTVVVSCGHRIHSACFSSTPAIGGRSHTCPLCRTAYRGVLRQYYTPPNGVDREVLVAPPNDTSCELGNQMRENGHRDNVERAAELMDALVAIGSKPGTQPMAPPGTPAMESMRHGFTLITEIAPSLALLPDTLAMIELALRMPGTRLPLSNALLLVFSLALAQLLKPHFYDVTVPQRAVLRSLIQFRAVEANVFDPTNHSHPERWVLNHVLELFFAKHELLQTLTRMGMAMLMGVVSRHYSTIGTTSKDLWFALAGDFAKHGLFTDVGDLRRTEVYETIKGGILSGHHKRENIDEVVSMYGSVVAVFLRQMFIFKDILTMKDDDTAQFVSQVDASSFDTIEGLAAALEVPMPGDIVIRVASTDTDNDLERNCFNSVTLSTAGGPESKIGVPFLRYPGPDCGFISLPYDYSDCLVQVGQLSARQCHRNMCCLRCGAAVLALSPWDHNSKCWGACGVYFMPAANSVTVAFGFGAPGALLGRLAGSSNLRQYLAQIPGPYMTIHGEIKRARNSARATLSDSRYQLLQLMWMQQTLIGYLTRNGLAQEYLPEMLHPMFTGTADDESDEDDEEDDVWHEVGEDEMEIGINPFEAPELPNDLATTLRSMADFMEADGSADDSDGEEMHEQWNPETVTEGLRALGVVPTGEGHELFAQAIARFNNMTGGDLFRGLRRQQSPPSEDEVD